LCYRCYKKGHTISECTAILCCDFCCGDHVQKVCPFGKKTSISALPFGYAVEGLGFYYIPISNEHPKVKAEEKFAMVHVLEGSLTVESLTGELEKLLPGNFKWEVEVKGQETFITNFPSSDWLEAVVNWGVMDTKLVKGKIKFEKFIEKDVHSYEIDKVWVQFTGLPKEHKVFPIIWAIASILGVPKTVDMNFLKKNGRARLKVAVLDPSLIPVFVDVVIGDDVYQLQFGVEETKPDGEPELLDMDSTMEDDDPAAEEAEKEANPNTNPKENIGVEKPMDIDGKNSSDKPPAAQLAAAPTEAIISDKNKPLVLLTSEKAGQVNAKVLKKFDDSGNIDKTKGKLGGTMSPGRSSKRIASNMDQVSTEKAAKLKARQNLEFTYTKGNCSQLSTFAFRDDSCLVKSTNDLGILLGVDSCQVHKSLDLLREIECQRLIERRSNLNELNAVADDTSTVCSDENCLDLEALNLICSEVVEVLGDGGVDAKCLRTPVLPSKRASSKSSKKKKKLVNKKNIQKSV
jgi:hypothetical protein